MPRPVSAAARPFLATLALVPLVASPASSSSRTAAGDGPVPFADLAHDLLERADAAEASPDLFDAHQFLAEHYVWARLGLYRAHLARHEADDRAHAKDFAEMLGVLVQVQQEWLAWLEPAADPELVAATRADLDALAGWVKGVRGDAIRRAAAEGGTDLLEALGAPEGVRSAAERLATTLGTGALLGIDRDDRPEYLVLAPTRIDFLEHAALAGWVYPDQQATYWGQGVATWTQFYMDDISVFALEFAEGGGVWKRGTSMNARNDEGMAQQVSQLAANSLLDSYYGSSIPPSFAGALAVNLTIDAFGECDTRADGDLRARRTEAYEMFVPGGNSEGGTLSMNSAVSRWREDQGKDGFIGVLKESQRGGGKKAKREGAAGRHFELMNDGKTERTVVRGPFLGRAAEGDKGIPSAFEGDWLEFLRAYRSGFVWWLRRNAAGKPKESGVAFARLLRELAAPPEGADLEQVLAGAYGRSGLSDGDAASETLEGAFLDWLVKGR